MLTEHALVALPCKLSPGIVSGERVFEVALANGRTYTGVAPRHFCWNAQGRLVGEKEPGGEAEGMVAARIVEELEDDQVAVEVPDGEVIAVNQDQIQPRPTPVQPPSSTPATR